MDVNSMTPVSGRIIAEDGSVANIVDLLGADGASPIPGKTYDINAYSPRTGRVIGEDGRLYNIVDLLGKNNGGGISGGGGVNYGTFNAHEETVEIKFDDEKRLTLEGNGNFTSYDDASGEWRMTAWLKAVYATGSFQTRNVFGTTKLLIDNDTGYSAGRAALSTVQLFYHRDKSMYDISVLTWANGSNTSTVEPGAGNRLENVVFNIKRVV